MATRQAARKWRIETLSFSKNFRSRELAMEWADAYRDEATRNAKYVEINFHGTADFYRWTYRIPGTTSPVMLTVRAL